MFEILTAAVLRIQVFQYAVPCHWDCLTLKTKALQYFEMSGTTHPVHNVNLRRPESSRY